MSTTPLLTQELALAHGRTLLEEVATNRRIAAFAAPSRLRRTLALVGSLLIAAGERLGGIRATDSGELAGAAR
jgi:hypothetical protein